MPASDSGVSKICGASGNFAPYHRFPLGWVQDVHLYAGIEIQRGGLVVLAIDHDHIARPKLFLNRLGEIVRKENRRETC